MHSKAIILFGVTALIAYVQANNQLHDMQGQLVKTLREFDGAVKMQPGNHTTVFRRGTIHLALGQLRSAVADFRRALVLKPDFITAHFQLGAVYVENGAYHLARTSFETVLRLKANEIFEESASGRGPTNRNIHDIILVLETKRLLCRCYMHEERYEKAMRVCKNEADIKLDAQLLSTRADTFLSYGMFDKALKDYKLALKMDKDLVHAAEGIQKATELIKEFAKRGYQQPCGQVAAIWTPDILRRIVDPPEEQQHATAQFYKHASDAKACYKESKPGDFSGLLRPELYSTPAVIKPTPAQYKKRPIRMEF